MADQICIIAKDIKKVKSKTPESYYEGITKIPGYLPNLKPSNLISQTPIADIINI